MLAPIKWLSRYVDLSDVPPEKIADILTSRGLEIVSVDDTCKEIQNVMVGKIEQIEKHANSNHLLICQINVGAQTIQIVTGAHNILQGDYIPVALEGAVLPGGVAIKKSKMRGVDSLGMLCSGKELNLKEEDYKGAAVDGILILHAPYTLGMDIKAALGLGGYVLEAEPTPNRPDLMSMVGIARELAAALGRELKLPVTDVLEKSSVSITDHVKIDVNDVDLCPRYMARTVTNIKIAPSPDWMQQCLRAAGMRPINNIVDITNFVMLETGQPMHSFDLSCVSEEHIIVRRALVGEKTTSLDGKVHILPEDTLVIADPYKAIGIAGIMGGEDSEITANTNIVLFESAKFDATNIRLCSKAMGMATDASARFVKGIDIETTAIALERACQLVEELEAGVVEKGVIDVCKGDISRRKLIARPQRVNALIALDVSAQKMADILNSLCIPTRIADGLLDIEIPHFRDDIEGEADISEELARVVGYDNIPLTLIRGNLMRGALTKRQKQVDRVRELLTAQGANEAVTYSFTGQSTYDKLLLESDHALRDSVSILNPFGEDNSLMRTTAITGMLPVIATNVNHKIKACRFFEITNVHTPSTQVGVIPVQKQVVCIGLYGADEDFYTLKGVVERLCEGLDIADVDYTAGGDTCFHPGRKALIFESGIQVGQMGEVHPDCAANFDIPVRVYIAEIELDKLFACSNGEKKFAPLPRFPSVERDIAILIDDTAQSGAIAKSIKKAGGEMLESVTLFDVYQGGNIESGKKSLAYSMHFRAPDKTLTDEETQKLFDKILNMLAHMYHAQIRQ